MVVLYDYSSYLFYKILNKFAYFIFSIKMNESKITLMFFLTNSQSNDVDFQSVDNEILLWEPKMKELGEVRILMFDIPKFYNL